MFKRIFIWSFWMLLTHLGFGQMLFTDSLDKHSFVRYDLNKISVKDSTTLNGLFEQIYQFEKTDTGKIKILHIGDSHLQAGYFSGKMRECLHKGLGCGTRERGFVFPFGLAHTNGPDNYAAQYTGKWYGCKNASNIQACNWGVAGILAYTESDTADLKVYSNNHTFQSYDFKKITLFLEDTSKAYQIELNAHKAEVISQKFDTISNSLTFELNKNADTLWFTFLKDTSKNGQLVLHGINLENDESGIVYSEVGVNGAKVQSFLRGDKFCDQLYQLNPDLLVLSLGTNDAYSEIFNDTLFFGHYDTLISQIKEVLPKSQIIITTPGDCKRYRIQPVEENILVRKRIFELAQKHNCAVWDFFNIMGGLGSIDQWHLAGLTATDKVHLNAKGYALQGNLLYRAFGKAYNDYTSKYRAKPVNYNLGTDWKGILEGLFFYSDQNPLVFSNYQFWVFFGLFLLIYSVVYQKTNLRSWYLFLFSLFFYYKSGGFYFSLLILSTVLDYFIGNRIFKSQILTHKKWWLVLSLVCNLGLLVFFKYSYFLVENFNALFNTDFQVFNLFAHWSNQLTGGQLQVSEIILPVGISFYTFQTISYSIDIYRERIQPVKNIIDFGFFVSFFPQLVAGPIVRANEFIPQIHQPYSLSKQQLSRATFLILAGLFKKMVISDYLSINYVDRVFEAPLKYSGFENLMASYGYAIQIYCDFSAYSDIAIGLALLLGFNLPQNFNAPYLAASITEFWRRWHMSLSRWLKDYLYIPLGGNRKGKFRMHLNLFITMLLGGLWHGDSGKFIIWGGLHGLALIIHKLYLSKFGTPQKTWRKVLGVVITFHFVVFCWLFFRAPSIESVFFMLQQIFTAFHLEQLPQFLSAYPMSLAILAFGLLLHLVPDTWENNIQSLLEKAPIPGIAIASILVVFIIYQFKSSGIQPFIYFQF